VGIQVEFSREGHLGTRIIHLSSAVKTTVSIVSAGACNVSEPAVRIGQSDASLPNNRISILRDADGADAEGSYLK
jgi:hypothetical protein